jgi:hypothetical protein
MHDVDRQNPAPSSRGFAFDDAALARVNCLGTPPRPGVLNRGSRLPLGKKRPTEVPFEATGPLTTPSPLWEKLSDAHPTYGIDVVALTLAVALPTRCRQPERRSLSNSPLTRLPSTARDRPSLPPQLPLLMIQHGAAAGHFPQPQSIAERRAVKRTAPTPAACGKARVRLASGEAEEDWVGGTRGASPLTPVRARARAEEPRGFDGRCHYSGCRTRFAAARARLRGCGLFRVRDRWGIGRAWVCWGA